MRSILQSNVSKKTPHPLYIQVKNDIEKQIDLKQLKPGDVLPTEEWMCNFYKVSRVTVRKAIEELINDGFVERDFSKAARVAHKKVTRNMNHLEGLYEELKNAGFKPSSYILKSELIEADESIAEKLGIKAGDKVLYIDRLRYADEQPICQQFVYINHALCPDLEAKDIIGNSLYGQLEKKCRYKIDYAKQTIGASVATYKQAALLEMEERSNLLNVNRSTYLTNGVCIEYSESFYVASRYHLSMTLFR